MNRKERERAREKQYEAREGIKRQVKKAVGKNRRIKFQVDTIPKKTEGDYDTKLTLWYAPGSGRDDRRDISQDGGVPRIQRLKINEANKLGEIAQYAAEALPQFNVVLAGAYKGMFTYHFIPR